jgi:hypothetical protein
MKAAVPKAKELRPFGGRSPSFKQRLHGRHFAGSKSLLQCEVGIPACRPRCWHVLTG